jgi:hypothetical protein
MTLLFEGWAKTISRTGPLDRGSLGFARDDKGEGGAFIESGFFSYVGRGANELLRGRVVFGAVFQDL